MIVRRLLTKECRARSQVALELAGAPALQGDRANDALMMRLRYMTVEQTTISSP